MRRHHQRGIYSVEYTDTFSGEANYSWVKRHEFKARTPLGIGVELRPYGMNVVLFLMMEEQV